MALADTIQDLLAQKKIKAAANLDRRHIVADWQRDVDQVLFRVKATIQPFIDNGATTFISQTTEIDEEALGDYRAQQLTFTIADRQVVVAPVAQMTFGGTGRIDMYRDDRPSERDRFLIVRQAGAGDVASLPWLMENKDEAPPEALAHLARVRRSDRWFYPLSAPLIESAVDHLLRMA